MAAVGELFGVADGADNSGCSKRTNALDSGDLATQLGILHELLDRYFKPMNSCFQCLEMLQHLGEQCLAEGGKFSALIAQQGRYSFT
jgi:hypothetical protein